MRDKSTSDEVVAAFSTVRLAITQKIFCSIFMHVFDTSILLYFEKSALKMCRHFQKGAHVELQPFFCPDTGQLYKTRFQVITAI
jgi:hypothetical protein